jgi:hypothetical protein
MNEDYMRGFSGQTTSPQNYDEQRGILDRQWNEEQQRQRERSHTGLPSPGAAWPASQPYAGTGGGGGLLVVILLLVVGPPLLGVLIFALPTVAFVASGAFLSSFVAGLILVALTPLLTRGQVAYREARRASFAGSWRYLAVTAAITFVVTLLQGPAVPSSHIGSAVDWLWDLPLASPSLRPFSMTAEVSTLAAKPIDTWPAIIGVLFVTRAPGLLWFTYSLRTRLPKAFAGRRGLLAAGLLALIGVEAALSVGLWASRALAARSQVMPFTGDERLTMLVAYCGLVLLPCAVVGALVAGPVLRALTPRDRTLSPPSGRRTYFAALRALLAFGAVTILALVLFRDADPLLWQIVDEVIGGRPVPAWNPSARRQAVIAVVACALPGLLWAASIVAASRPMSYPGGRGYLKAVGIAAVACAVGLLPSWALALWASQSLRAW